MGRFGIAIEVSISSVGSGASETRESLDKGAIEPGLQALQMSVDESWHGRDQQWMVRRTLDASGLWC